MKLSRLGKLRKQPHVPTITDEPMKYHLPPKDTIMDSDSQAPDQRTDSNWLIDGDPSRLWLSGSPGAPDRPFLPRDVVLSSISFVFDCDGTPDRHTRNREFVDKDGRTIEHLIYCSRCLTKTHLVDSHTPAKVDFLTSIEAQSSAVAVLDIYHRTESNHLMGLLWAAHERFQRYADAKNKIEREEVEAKKWTSGPWRIFVNNVHVGFAEGKDGIEAKENFLKTADIYVRDGYRVADGQVFP